MAWLHQSVRSVSTVVIGLVALIVVLIVLTVLFENFVPWERVPWGGVEARGRIVAHEPVRRDVALVYPVVIFTTVDNEYRFVETRPFRAGEYPVGAWVTVLYNAATPDVARISSYEDLAFNAAAIAVVVVIVVLGLARAMRPLRR